MVRGSERLTTRLSELEGLVLAAHTGFEWSLRYAFVECALHKFYSLPLNRIEGLEHRYL